MEMLQGVWKQHLRPRAVVGYGVKILLTSPPNYVTRSPGCTNKHEGYTGQQKTTDCTGLSVLAQSMHWCRCMNKHSKTEGNAEP